MTERVPRSLSVALAILVGGASGGGALFLLVHLWRPFAQHTQHLALHRATPPALISAPADGGSAGGGAIDGRPSPKDPAGTESAAIPDGAPAAAHQAPAASTVRRPYNVVLITVDTLRYDLGYTGYARPITPNIDALAERAIVYERAYATASYTPKSLGPMLIGRYASETFRDPEHYTTFYPANVFIAERVRAAGARTFAAMCQHYFKWDTGLSQGFDIWDTAATPRNMTDNDTSITGDRLTARALALLSDPANVDRRFFAWFHYFDPHAQYVAHEGAPSFSTRKGPPTQRTLYDQEIWFTDQQIGRVLDHIAAQPWAADTAIVVTADHGEAFGEHGHWKHGRELWESIVRVPLVVYIPGAKPRRIAIKRSQIDIAPTILDLIGAPPVEAGTLRGTSLLSDVLAPEGDALEERDVYFDMPEGPFNEMRRGIITGTSPGLKLIDFAGHRYEMYDLTEDPEEKKDIVTSKERFRAALTSLQRTRAHLQEIRPTR
ncbi:sulfatase [Pendulispora albinea]|uniref:Sulfatase n=1 Tax=Pendulispora albinea TaxID=2741071 RepID=A0ABZ2M4H5_9BACT